MQFELGFSSKIPKEQGTYEDSVDELDDVGVVDDEVGEVVELEVKLVVGEEVDDVEVEVEVVVDVESVSVVVLWYQVTRWDKVGQPLAKTEVMTARKVQQSSHPSGRAFGGRGRRDTSGASASETKRRISCKVWDIRGPDTIAQG